MKGIFSVILEATKFSRPPMEISEHAIAIHILVHTLVDQYSN